MASIKYRLRSRANKNVSIYIVLSLGRGKQHQTTTGFSINPKDWKENIKNSSKQYGFPKNSKLTKIKNIKSDLLKLESNLVSAVNSANANGEIINIDWLKNNINICFGRNLIETDKKERVVDYVEFVIENANTKTLQNGKIGLSESRIKGYTTFKNLLKRFEKYQSKKLYFRDIDINFEDAFKDWLINNQKYKITYASKNFDNLKAVCNEALRYRLDVNPHFKNILTFSENKIDKINIGLSFKELEIIENCTLNNDDLENARKYLLIGCHSGLRYSDISKLTVRDIINDNGFLYMENINTKTNIDVVIPILEEAERTIKKGFPKKIPSQKLNTYLKQICKIAEIDEIILGDKKIKNRLVRGYYPKYELVSSKVFRKSFATNYYKHIETSILMAITGHKRESTFLAYVGKSKDKFENAKLMREKVKEMKAKQNKTKVIELNAINQ
jgi:integrase